MKSVLSSSGVYEQVSDGADGGSNPPCSSLSEAKKV